MKRGFRICSVFIFSFFWLTSSNPILALSEGQTSVTPLPAAFVELVSALGDLASVLDPKPAAWCRFIVNQGNKADLLSLDTSTRSMLGKEVERQLRAVKIVSDFELQPEAKPDYLKTDWTEARTINSGVMALLDLMSMVRNNDTCMELAKVNATIDALSGFAVKAADLVKSELKEAKDGVAIVFGKLRQMMVPVEADRGDWITAPEVETFVKHFNEQKNELSGALEGLGRVKNSSE